MLNGKEEVREASIISILPIEGEPDVVRVTIGDRYFDMTPELLLRFVEESVKRHEWRRSLP